MDIKMSGRVMEIELFRFLFSVMILFRHAEYLLGENLLFPGAAFGVEFFFLVSGYLMMASLEKMASIHTDDLGRETLLFLKKKAGAVYPEFFVSAAIGFTFQWFSRALSWDEVEKLLSESFFELTFLTRVGLGENNMNSVIWYVQAMLLGMLILYPLNRKYPKMMRTIIMPFAALVLLGYLNMKYGHLRSPSRWTGWTYKGNVRAIAELCLGAEAFFVVRWLKGMQFSRLGKTLLTALKWLCWIVIMVYMWNPLCDKDFFMLAVLWAAVVLAFSGQCLDVEIYRNKLVAFLGKFSLPIYLSHAFYCLYMSQILPEGMRYRYMLMWYVGCSVLTAFVVMYLAGVIRKKLPSLNAAMKRCFLVQ